MTELQPISHSKKPAIDADEDELLVTQLCIKQLGHSETDLEAAFTAIQRRRSITWKHYVRFLVMRTNPLLIFDNYNLAFDILRQPGTKVILQEGFVTYAHAIIPVATDRNVHAIFDILKTIPSAADTLAEEHITERAFSRYVSALKENWFLAQEPECRTVCEKVGLIKPSNPTPRTLVRSNSLPEAGNTLSGDEEDSPIPYETNEMDESLGTLVLLRSNLTLQSLSAPTGSLVVTDTWIMFVTSAYKIVKKLPVEQLISVMSSKTGVFRSNVTLTLHFNDGAPNREDEVVEISFGSGRDIEKGRDSIAAFLMDMHQAVVLCKETLMPAVQHVVMEDCIHDVLRQKALRDSHFRGDVSRASFLSSATIDEKKAYVRALEEQLTQLSKTRGLLSNMLGTNKINTFRDPLVDTRIVKWMHNPQKKKIKQKLDFTTLSREAKLLMMQIKPIAIMQLWYLNLIQWTNPQISFAVTIGLLFLAFADWVRFLPAFVCLANAAFLYYMQYHPAEFDAWIERQLAALMEEPKPQTSNDEDDDNADRNHAHASVTSGFFHRIRSKVQDYKEAIAKTQDALETLQYLLSVWNHRILKVKGLYMWLAPDLTKQYLLASGFIGIILMLVPFRLLFAAAVFVRMTSVFRSNTKDTVAEFFARIPAARPPIGKPKVE